MPANGLSLTAKRHRQRRRIDRARVERLGDRRVADGVGDGRLDQPGDGDDVARLGVSTGTRSSPRKANILVARPFSTTLPSTSIAWIGMLTLSVPLSIRPVRMRPRNGVAVEQRDEHLELAVGVERAAPGHG